MTIVGTTAVVHYANFDWLRLLLSVQVVAVHCGIAPTVFLNPVPAFLAISGFVVLGSMERRSLPHFFISRALRVLPLLAVSFLAVGYFWGGKAMIQTVLFWLWPRSDIVTPNPVVWTLIYEEVIYVLLSILSVLGLYRTRWMPIILCGSVIGIAIFVPLYGYAEWSVLGASFLIGNVLYIFREAVVRLFSKSLATVLFVLSVAFVYTLPYDNLVRPPVQYLDFLSFAAMLVFAIAGPQLPKLKLDLSYSLYLTHCLVRGQLRQFIPIGSTLFWFVLLASLPICFACWYLIEKPALSLKERLLNNPPGSTTHPTQSNIEPG